LGKAGLPVPAGGKNDRVDIRQRLPYKLDIAKVAFEAAHSIGRAWALWSADADSDGVSGLHRGMHDVLAEISAGPGNQYLHAQFPPGAMTELGFGYHLFTDR
jgi:hypothetical protein